MPEHFADYIKVDRYKCFENFSIEGLKRVNLISGKNNVGKTALMEAMCLSSLAKDVSHLVDSLIPSVRDSEAGIIRSYTRVQAKERESDVNAFIARFDDSIENVKVIGDAVQCKVPSRDGGFEYRSLNEFGDGLRHYLSVITNMFAAENECIFIDELDNGIHYTLLDQFWEIILTLSKELNVQVFATTHSKECIESCCRVTKKLDEREVSLITLVRNKSQQAKAIVRDFDMLTDSIDDNREVRGW